jgi:hypothetical protein
MSERQQPAPESLDDAIEAFQRMSVPDRPPDAVVLERLGGEWADKPRPAASPISPTRSGWLVSLLIPSAAAAMLVLGALGLLLLIGNTPPALADVVKAAAKHKLVRYHEQQLTETKEHSSTARSSTVYADLTAPRLYSESRTHDPDGGLVLLSVHDGKHHLTTNSRQKAARLALAPKGYRSLLCCLEEFEKKEGVAQQKDELDGQPVVKYRHVEGKQTTILWVDVRTKLPLRFEQDSIGPNPDVVRTTLVWADFVWGPELPPGIRSLDELFSTRPPKGYALDDQTRRRKQ